jgi:coenzyme F420 hydrogenase subunit beta
MSVRSIDKLRFIMQSHLCTRCGSCVGLSEGKIIFKDREGQYRPHILTEPSEEQSGRLLNACPGKDFDYKHFRELFYKDAPEFHVYTGPVVSINIAYSNDQLIRTTGASGGMISAILIWLLQNGRIDGAVVTGMSEEKPWLTRSYIATTPDQILEAAQSKYIITSVNEILPDIEAFNGRLAYVGLPAQVQSIRKLQAAKDPSVKNIQYILGPFYGNTLHFSSIRYFLESYNIKDYQNISKLYFRHGEWPGNMRIEMNDGRVVQLPKFHANYLIPFHIMVNSLLCTDLSNEFTDISGGDAWAPKYEERGKGFSMVIARSAKGNKILNEMYASGAIDLMPITIDEAITMHSHGYDLKKRGTFIRFKFRKWLGLTNPDYGYEIKGFPISRYFMEFAIDALFLIAGTATARWLVAQLPPAFIGNVFERVRNIWKKATFGIKRDNLNQ